MTRSGSPYASRQEVRSPKAPATSREVCVSLHQLTDIYWHSRIWTVVCNPHVMVSRSTSITRTRKHSPYPVKDEWMR